MSDERDYLARLRGYADLFYSYFPTSQSERDLVLLRGHQLIEALVFQFLRQHVNSPDELENFHARWDAVLALARSLRYQNEKDEAWVWQSSTRLERARNRVAHFLESQRADQAIADFVNSVRSNFSGYSGIPGEDDLKKCIFILYFSLSRLLALEEFPPCTATSLVREEIARECQRLVSQGVLLEPGDA